jgi:hypothetical protein
VGRISIARQPAEWPTSRRDAVAPFTVERAILKTKAKYAARHRSVLLSLGDRGDERSRRDCSELLHRYARYFDQSKRIEPIQRIASNVGIRVDSAAQADGITLRGEGETSVHANPGPDAVDYRAEHDPPHVHIGSNSGPRVSTKDFRPL